MSDWTAGYVADIAYTFGYYLEMNPTRIRQAFLQAGLVPPTVSTACELGFGQGLSTAIHAAASGVTWYGTDFNPTQAGFAQELARQSGSGAQLFDQAFDEFCSREDLPDFDFIALHGIWSWISDANRSVIVDFLRRKLKVGGVLYISYNTEPGWAAMLPLRRLMAQHSQVMSASGAPMVDKVESAIVFAERLMATDPASARANPQLAERLKSIRSQNRNYVAHEYFNSNWDPMGFSTMAEWLAPAKLGFACSAHLLDHISAINVTPAQSALLAEMPDPVMREATRDFMTAQTFRRDFWVRGARPMPRAELGEATGRQRVMLSRPRAEITLKVRAALGEADMTPAVYDTLLDQLGDLGGRSVAELDRELAGKGLSTPQLVQAILILVGKGDLAIVQDDAVIAQARERCAKLNTYLITRARNGNDITFLASPVTGGGISVSRFDQLFLSGRLQGKQTPTELATVAATALKAEGTSLLKEGKPVLDDTETLAILSRQAGEFIEQRLPLLQALGIAT